MGAIPAVPHFDLEPDVVLTAIPAVPHFDLEPDVVLTVILPPLLYGAARQVPFVNFRRNLRVIGFLAIVLVVVSAVLVGVAVSLIWVAPPDAVAATSLGKRLGFPPRIVTILEGRGSSTTRPRWWRPFARFVAMERAADQ